nr:unnamed protein product [Callosobruchus chinensis]
MKSQLGQ